jgi:glycosyltransferase involved in cell wall biosynthesis
MDALRIGVNALYLIPGGVGGTEIYLRNLLAAMARVDAASRYFVFINRETESLAPDAENFADVRQRVRAMSRPARLLWEQFHLPREARRLALDVLWNPGFTAPVELGCPQVTTFHDLQHKRYPEFFRWWELPFWRFFLWASARRSERLIAVSRATAADLLRYYPRLDPDGIDVIPHGVEDAFFSARDRWEPDRERPYLLCASTLHPHKNHARLLRAFAQAREARPEFRLVLTGVRGFVAAEVEAAIRDLGLERSVEFTGWLPRAALIELFRRAWAFVYPSRFEGFGMPVMEALAAGLPCACSDIEPLRSLAGEAALRFPPEEEDEIAHSLERLMTDGALRAELHAAGPERASKWRWEDAARATRETLAAAARRR